MCLNAFDYFLMILISLNSYMGFRNHVSGTHDPFIDEQAIAKQWETVGTIVLNGPVKILTGPVETLTGPVKVLARMVIILTGPVKILTGTVKILTGPIKMLIGLANM